ncbi:MAG: hypothetical protein QW303_00080 [Nitrososphaerota archaeon]
MKKYKENVKRIFLNSFYPGEHITIGRYELLKAYDEKNSIYTEK